MNGAPRGRALATAACLALLAVSAPAVGQESDATRSLGQWTSAASSFPNDPDIAWAYALALIDAGREESALRQLRTIGARWPERKADADFKIGTIHWEEGSYAAALREFENAIEADPMRGDARLYRALALQSLGRDGEAERELAVLAQISPDLAPDAFLLRGLERLRRGDRAGSQEFLTRVVALDASGDRAAQARSVLAQLGPEAMAGNRVVAWATLGGESDSNVLLDSGLVPASGRADIGLEFGAGLAGSVYRTEGFDFSLGYAHNGSSHHDLKDNDLQADSLVSSSAWLIPDFGAVRLDTALLDGRMGGLPYLMSALFRPNVLIRLAGSSTTLRVFGEYERRGFQEDPGISSLDRDGSTYRAGLEATLPLWAGASGSMLASLGRTNTRATPDLLGFKGDFDSRQVALAAWLRLPLGDRCDGRLGGGWTRDRYVNPSLIDLLTDPSSGSSDPQRRLDVTLNGVAGLGCELTPSWRVETRWSGTRDRSNVAVYDYRRNVIGLYLSSEFGWL